MVTPSCYIYIPPSCSNRGPFLASSLVNAIYNFKTFSDNEKTIWVSDVYETVQDSKVLFQDWVTNPSSSRFGRFGPDVFFHASPIH